MYLLGLHSLQPQGLCLCCSLNLTRLCSASKIQLEWLFFWKVFHEPPDLVMPTPLPASGSALPFFFVVLASSIIEKIPGEYWCHVWLPL